SGRLGPRRGLLAAAAQQREGQSEGTRYERARDEGPPVDYLPAMLHEAHVHPVQIYYEDTDHSGVVYHANYLRYFERAREHVLGVRELVALYNEQGIGFVVYHAELTYRDVAVFGDTLEIHTRVFR